jgi:endonuclease/exonuclease/phosphatase (EEP) superfamily protein YafD
VFADLLKGERDENIALKQGIQFAAGDVTPDPCPFTQTRLIAIVKDNFLMRLISWNVNGIRAAVKKDFFNAIAQMQADVLCLQETKAQDEQVITALGELGRLSCVPALRCSSRLFRHRGA